MLLVGGSLGVVHGVVASSLRTEGPLEKGHVMHGACCCDGLLFSRGVIAGGVQAGACRMVGVRGCLCAMESGLGLESGCRGITR